MSQDQTRTDPPIEKLLTTLEELVRSLEAGDLPLETAMERFEEGMALVRAGRGILERARSRMEEIIGEGPDGPLTREVEVELDETNPS